MSVPEGTRPRWPLRSAGFALLGIATAAALTGVVLLVSDNGATVSDGRRPGASGPAPGSASARPSATSTPSSRPPATTTTAPTSRPAPAPGPAAPGPAAPGTAAPPAPTPRPAPTGRPAPAGPGVLPPGTDTDVAASGKGERRGQTRVYNNSTIHGLAARAASDLTAAGWTVAEVGNYSGGRIWTTTVYYQEGTDQRGTAEEIGARFKMRVEPRFPGIAGAKPGIIVIVTNDYGR